MSKYTIFTRMDEEPEQESLTEVKEELEKLVYCMGKEDEFIVLKDGRYYGRGDFEKEIPKIKRPRNTAIKHSKKNENNE